MRLIKQFVISSLVCSIMFFSQGTLSGTSKLSIERLEEILSILDLATMSRDLTSQLSIQHSTKADYIDFPLSEPLHSIIKGKILRDKTFSPINIVKKLEELVPEESFEPLAVYKLVSYLIDLYKKKISPDVLTPRQLTLATTLLEKIESKTEKLRYENLYFILEQLDTILSLPPSYKPKLITPRPLAKQLELVILYLQKSMTFQEFVTKTLLAKEKYCFCTSGKRQHCLVESLRLSLYAKRKAGSTPLQRILLSLLNHLFFEECHLIYNLMLRDTEQRLLESCCLDSPCGPDLDTLWCPCTNATLSARLIFAATVIEKIIERYPVESIPELHYISLGAGYPFLDYLIIRYLLSLGYQITAYLIDPIYIREKESTTKTISMLNEKLLAVSGSFKCNTYFDKEAYLETLSEMEQTVFVMIDPSLDMHEGRMLTSLIEESAVTDYLAFELNQNTIIQIPESDFAPIKIY